MDKTRFVRISGLIHQSKSVDFSSNTVEMEIVLMDGSVIRSHTGCVKNSGKDCAKAPETIFMNGLS